MSLCKTSDPWGQAIFEPQSYNLNNLGRGPQGKATYQISTSGRLHMKFGFHWPSGPSSFSEEDF